MVRYSWPAIVVVRKDAFPPAAPSLGLQGPMKESRPWRGKEPVVDEDMVEVVVIYREDMVKVMVVHREDPSRYYQDQEICMSGSKEKSWKGSAASVEFGGHM